MKKLIAIVNVIAWSGFWAFGYLAFSSEASDSTSTVIAILLAAAGAGVGLWAYLWLVRYCERTGYAKAPKRAYPQNNTPGEDI